VVPHHFHEGLEKIMRIVRAGGGFGVILNAEERQSFVAQAFVGVVVEIEVRDFDFAGGERVRVDAEAVILRSNFDFLREQILNGMIGAVVAEFKFEGFSAEGQAANLVTEADAKDGDPAEQFFYVFDGVAHGLGIAGTVGEEDAIGAHGENVLGHGGCGDYDDLALMIDEEAQNILLDAEIVGHYAEFPSASTCSRFTHLLGPGSGCEVDGGFLPVVALFAGDTAGELLSGHAGELFGFVD